MTGSRSYVFGKKDTFSPSFFDHHSFLFGPVFFSLALIPEVNMDFNKNVCRILIAISLLTFIGCQKRPDFHLLRSEILDLHTATIDAHWDKDVDFFVQDISEEYFSVGNGEIRHPTKEEMRSEFSSYLNNTTFTEYRDLREPIISFSKDGSLAWSIVQVKVAGSRTRDDGGEREMDFTCAWITLYERRGDGWIRLGEVSNFK
jgi:hypothetical protein